MADPTSMRKHNLLEVLRAIDTGGNMTAAAIAEQTNLSVATISRALMLLKNMGLIVQLGKERAEIGRRPELFRINAQYGYHLYFYLSGGTLSGYLQDFCGTRKACGQVELPPACGVVDLMAAIDTICSQLVQSYHRADGNILAISLAIPGVSSHDGLVSRIPNYPGLEGVPLTQRIRQTSGLPCFVYNIAKLSAMGEYLTPASRAGSLAYVEITGECGIGAGLVLGGRLYEGAGSRAGEIGDMIVGLPVGVHTDTSQGVLEAQAGLSSVYDRVHALLRAGNAQTLAALLAKTGGKLELHTLEKAARAMDLDVFDVLNHATQLWAAAIVNILTVVAPDEVIVGGALSSENRLIEKLLNHHLHQMYHSPISLRFAKKNSLAHLTGANFFSKQYLFDMVVGTVCEDS